MFIIDILLAFPCLSVCTFRLEGLQALAEKILSECDSHEAKLGQLEKKIEEFEQNSATMDPQEAAKMAAELQGDIEVSTSCTKNISSV